MHLGSQKPSNLRKILFIAPIPPPITGQSLASQVLLNELKKKYPTEVVDLSKESFKEGVNSFGRVSQVIALLKDIFNKKKQAKVIYLTISESFFGNVKDLLIYLICYRHLSNMILHLHGGSIKRLLWDNNKVLAKINYFFIGKMRGVIILGESHSQIFKGIIDPRKIHIVPNFAQEYLFATPEKITHKFQTRPLKVLYMSNLIPKKGYNEMADAFIEIIKSKNPVQVDFAGGFDSDECKDVFLEKIRKYPAIKYHGVVDGEQKKNLFSNAHIFCLPTSYFEGQPISILEAYAAGCVVMTTGQSGIYDVFQDQINGFEILPGSCTSIVNVFTKIANKEALLENIALNNLKSAIAKYRSHIYLGSICDILDLESD